MITRAWKVYGADGHRQRESFRESNSFTSWAGSRVEVENADKTGTHDYSIVRITAETAEACWNELDGQISDGIFENSRTGRVEEIEA